MKRGTFRKSKTNRAKYNKSKAAKQADRDQYAQFSSDTSLPKPQRDYYPAAREWRGGGYNDEFYGYGDQYEYEQFNDEYGNQGIYDVPSGMFEYASEESRYVQQPQHSRSYMMSETFNSDQLDSDWTNFDRPRGEGRGPMSEFTSEYSYRSQRPRTRYDNKYGRPPRSPPKATRRSPYRNDYDVYMANQPTGAFEKKQNDGMKESGKTDKIPYENDYNVYISRHPVGHRAFTMKENRDLREQTDFTTRSDSESVSEDWDSEVSLPPKGKRQPQFQVYAAQMEQNQAGVFDHQNRQEKTVLQNNDRNIPVLAFQDEKPNVDPNRESGVVYLPVMVVDNTIKLPQSKILSPELITNNTEEKTGKTLEQDSVQASAATDIGQRYMFQQENDRNIKYQQAKNLAGYNVQENSIILKEKPVSFKAQGQSIGKEGTEVQPKYPFQKPYIIVASKRQSKAESERSKPMMSIHSMKQSFSSTGSKLLHTDDDQTVKQKRYESTMRVPSLELTVVHPAQSKQEELQSEVSMTSLIPKSKSLVSKAETQNKKGSGVSDQQIKNKQSLLGVITTPTGSIKRTVVHLPSMAEEPNEEPEERSQALTNKSLTFEKKGSTAVCHTSLTRDSRIGEKNKSLTIAGKRCKTSNLEQRNKQEDHGSFLAGDSSVQPQREDNPKRTSELAQEKSTILSEKTSLTSKMLRSNSKESGALETSEFTLSPESQQIFSVQYVQSQQNLPSHRFSHNKRKPSSKKSMVKDMGIVVSQNELKTKGKKKTEDIKTEDKEKERLTIWGYDTTLLVYLFQIAQFFLGLSTHDTLMEALRTIND